MTVNIKTKESILFKLGNDALQHAWSFLPVADLGALSLTSKKTRQTALTSLFSELPSISAFINDLALRLPQRTITPVCVSRLRDLKENMGPSSLSIIQDRSNHSPETGLLNCFLNARDSLADIISKSALIQWREGILVLRPGINDCNRPSCLSDIFDRAIFLRKVLEAPHLTIPQICDVHAILLKQQKFETIFTFLLRIPNTTPTIGFHRSDPFCEIFDTLLQQQNFELAFACLNRIPTNNDEGNALLSIILTNSAEALVNANLTDRAIQMTHSMRSDRLGSFKGSVFAALCQSLIQTNQIEKAIEVANMVQSVHLDLAFLSLCEHFIEQSLFETAFAWIGRMHPRGESKKRALIKISTALLKAGLFEKEFKRIDDFTKTLHRRYRFSARALPQGICADLIHRGEFEQATQISNQLSDETEKGLILSRIQLARDLS